jgi:hypothetical protein
VGADQRDILTDYKSIWDYIEFLIIKIYIKKVLKFLVKIPISIIEVREKQNKNSPFYKNHFDFLTQRLKERNVL